MAPFLMAWLRAFVFTQLVEAPIYRYGGPLPWSYALGASAITHPIVWFVFFSPAFEASYEVRVCSAELFALVAEAWLASTRLPLRRAFGLSLAANAASVVTGEIARAITGYP